MFLLFMSIWAVAIASLIAFAVVRSKARVKAKARSAAHAQSGANEDSEISAAQRGKYFAQAFENGIVRWDHSILSGNPITEVDISQFFQKDDDHSSDPSVRTEHHIGRLHKAYAVDLSKGPSSGKENLPVIKVFR